MSAQRISDWRRARNVPAQFTALAAVLHILIPEARRLRPTPVSAGLYDLAHWQRLWELALAGPAADRAAPPAQENRRPPAQAPPVAGGVCPYRGLAPYRREDARWFFGRERSTKALVAQLRAAERSGGLVMLVGASGAGKSSLLNAGLVPAIRDGALHDGTAADPPDPSATDDSPEPAEAPAAPGPVLQLVPGADPLGELVRRVPELAAVAAEARRAEREAARNPSLPGSDAPYVTRAVRAAVAAWARRTFAPGTRPVVIVDQFEEAFTLCADEADRRSFIQFLHAACTPPAGAAEPAPVRVVLGIRADFYEQCLGYPDLADALQHRHMVLGPLTSTELREAVTGPAKAVGLELEPGLTELIVREVSADGPRGAHDAGVLPCCRTPCWPPGSAARRES